MRKIVSLLLLALSFIVSADVAYMYSGYPGGKKSFLNEFDKTFAELNVKASKYQNTQIADLTANLSKYDIVVLGSVANFENTVNLTPHAAAWKDYLTNGGLLFIADATYDSVINSFLNCISPELALKQTMCSAHLKPSPETKRADIHDHPLLYFPNQIKPVLEKLSHWGHFSCNQPEGWEIIESCADGKALTLAHRVGKGLVVVAAHGNLKSANGRDFATKLIANMLFQRTLATEDITIMSAMLPSDQFKTAMKLSVKAPGKTDTLSLALAYSSKDGMKQCDVRKTVAGDIVNFEVPIAYEVRGKIRHEAKLLLGQNAIATTDWQSELPQILEYKMRRKHFYPGETTLSVAFKAFPYAPEAGPLKLFTRIDGKAIQPNIAFNAMEASGNFSLNGLGNGRHVVTFELQQNGQTLTAPEAELFIHPEPTVRFREDGTMLMNGKPFFAFGMYHVSWSASPEHRKAMIADIAQYGYNVVHVGCKAGEFKADTFGEFLDECQKHGVYVITEFPVKEALAVIAKYKDHPAVLGWNPGDEPYPAGVSPEEMFRRYDSFKQLDPNHLAYTVICTPSQYKNYSSGTDVLAPDPYPVPKNPIDNVYKNYKDAHAEARKYDTALWAVPQCFGYDKGTWTRYPTADEYRSMLYLSLIAGVKGFVNYTYYDRGFFLPKAPGLWDACKTFPTEMKPLIPFILNGKRTVHQEDTKGIYTGTWSFDGRTAAVIVNASPDKALPFEIKGDFSNVSIHYGTVENLKTTANSLSGTLRSYGQAVLIK
ncbi:MAG: hypothetical protein J6X55_07055 [Victivallales bacterium]|nr:hypothetical protein [Victivallales bacterium]